MEELEDRFETRIDEMLDMVRSSLSQPPNPETAAAHEPSDGAHGTEEDVYMDEAITWDEYQVHDVEFDDTGEGAGVEGDLDVQDN